MSQAISTNNTSRRLFLAGAAAAAVVPIGAMAEPMPADAALVDAAAGVVQLDEAMEAFLANSDDDYHPDFQAMESQRSDHLETLATDPAVGVAGLRAKARTLWVTSVIQDFERHQDIALSLAKDLTEGMVLS